MSKNQDHLEQEALEILQGARRVDLIELLKADDEIMRTITRMGGSKPSKASQAFADEQQAKQKAKEDMMEEWVHVAFPEALENGYVGRHRLFNEYSITVLISKR
jgi:hypothetical protein